MGVPARKVSQGKCIIVTVSQEGMSTDRPLIRRVPYRPQPLVRISHIGVSQRESKEAMATMVDQTYCFYTMCIYIFVSYAKLTIINYYNNHDVFYYAQITICIAQNVVFH